MKTECNGAIPQFPSRTSESVFGPSALAEFSMLAFLAVTMGLPLFFLLIGSFNLAPPGKQAVYGFDNWVRAFSDPGTLSALWMSFLLSTVRLIPAMYLFCPFRLAHRAHGYARRQGRRVFLLDRLFRS